MSKMVPPQLLFLLALIITIICFFYTNSMNFKMQIKIAKVGLDQVSLKTLLRGTPLPGRLDCS